MSSRGHLFDTLPEKSATTNDVGDLRLINRNFNRAWPDVICGGMDIVKICFHAFLSMGSSPVVIRLGQTRSLFRLQCNRIENIVQSVRIIMPSPEPELPI